jgi:hypothetical protein
MDEIPKILVCFVFTNTNKLFYIIKNILQNESYRIQIQSVI